MEKNNQPDQKQPSSDNNASANRRPGSGSAESSPRRPSSGSAPFPIQGIPILLESPRRPGQTGVFNLAVSPNVSPRLPEVYQNMMRLENDASSIAGSPPAFMTLQDLVETALNANNMALAHEIAVNQNFRLEKYEPPSNSIEKQVRDTVVRAFWDVLRLELESVPPKYDRALMLLEEVRELLFTFLLPQHNQLKQEIEEVLDLDLIRRKLSGEVFELKPYANFVIGVLARLCAPARDPDIERLRSVEDVIDLFKGIYALMEQMKMDMANFTIDQYRPIIQQNAVEYERTNFEKLLEAQKNHAIDGLGATKKWFEHVLGKLSSQELSQTDVSSVVSRGYVDILFRLSSEDDRFSAESFPETLLLDQVRFADLAADLHQIISLSAVILITFTSVGDKIATVPDLKTKLKDDIAILLQSISNDSQLKDRLMAIAEHVVKLINEQLELNKRPVLSDVQSNSLKGQIQELYGSHTVVQLIRKRTADFLVLLMTTRQPSQQIRIPPGLSTMEREFALFCRRFIRLTMYNRSVFGEYYSGILGPMLAAARTAASPVAADSSSAST